MRAKRSAIIVCAGSSQRFGEDKLGRLIDGRTVEYLAIRLFLTLADEIIVVYGENNGERLRAEFPKGVTFVKGGASRSQSVYNGLSLCTGDIVAIHDGARPFVSAELIERVYAEAERLSSAVPYVACADAVRIKGKICTKSDVRLIQTPQAFSRPMLLEAVKKTPDCEDESCAWIQCYGDVNYIEGDYANKKITHRSDLSPLSFGCGYDIHRMQTGRALVLGGVTIDSPLGLVGHSDADVVIHAIMDAILGAMGKRDIGHYFPVSDSRYEGIASTVMLETVLELAAQEGYGVMSASVALTAERPHLSPYCDRIIANLAKLLRISPSDVGFSVTTAEGVGEIGAAEAMACRANVILITR